MDENYTNPDNSSGITEDPAVINALTYLCSLVGGFKKKPTADRLVFLENLGLSRDIAQRVVVSFESTFDFPRGPVEGNPETDPETDPIRCPINWHPNVLAPVFYGRQEIRIGNGDDAPCDMNIFYPTIDGIVNGAAFLQSCGPYPLILFAHGDCNLGGQDHFKDWYHLPAQLARSGYVVVVPKFGVTQLNSPEQLALAEDVVTWMQTRSVYATQLAATIGVVGHSYGGVLAGQLATRIPINAMVNLSGEWVEAAGIMNPLPLDLLNIPTLLFWGTDFSEFDANLDNGGLFERLPFPRHKIVFNNGTHWMYLPRMNRQACSGGSDSESCEVYKILAADFTALFFGRYLPPPNTSFPAVIRSRLLKPEYQLTFEQEFYAGAHLTGFVLIQNSRSCSLTHTWQLSTALTGSFMLPGN